MIMMIMLLDIHFSMFAVGNGAMIIYYLMQVRMDWTGIPGYNLDIHILEPFDYILKVIQLLVNFKTRLKAFQYIEQIIVVHYHDQNLFCSKVLRIFEINSFQSRISHYVETEVIKYLYNANGSSTGIKNYIYMANIKNLFYHNSNLHSTKNYIKINMLTSIFPK